MDKKRLNLVGLAVPIFVEQFLNKLLTMVNVYLLSRLSQEAVGAIGVANQFLNFITMAFSFVTFGAAVVIAQNRGAGEEERACPYHIVLSPHAEEHVSTRDIPVQVPEFQRLFFRLF